MHRVVAASEGARRGRDVVGHDPVAAFLLQLGLGVLDHVLGFGGEADDQARPQISRRGQRRQDVGILSQLQLGRRARAFLDLLTGLNLERVEKEQKRLSDILR